MFVCKHVCAKETTLVVSHLEIGDIGGVGSTVLNDQLQETRS